MPTLETTEDAVTGTLGVNNQILKALIDSIDKLPPEYKAPLLFFFIFAVIGLVSLPMKSHPNLPAGCLIAMSAIAVIFMMTPRKQIDPNLSVGLAARKKLILGDAPKIARKSAKADAE